MDKNEQFFCGEDDGETTKQSPGSSQTWPMDKIRQSRFQPKMSSLLSPVTPKRNYSVRHSKSLLLQYLRDSKSDPLPRRRFPASYSDDGILMDGVLVTSATGKKVSDSPSRSLGRSVRSSIIRSQHKNTEFSSPRSEPRRNQETTRSQQSSAGKGKMLANSPGTKVETPKAANPSKLQATAEPFILTPKSSQRLASPVPLQQLPYDHSPRFPCGNSPLLRPPSYGCPYRPPPSYAYPRALRGPPLPYVRLPESLHGSDLYHTHLLVRSPRPPIGYHFPHDFNQSPTRNNPRNSLPTTPSPSQPNTDTPNSTNPAPNLSTNTTTSIHDSRLNLPDSLDEIYTVTQKLDLSSYSDERERVRQKPDLCSPSAGLETVTTEKDWSPCDDGVPELTQAQTDFRNAQCRVLPDDVLEHYKYRQRLPVFGEICLDDNLPKPQPQDYQ